MKGPFTCGASEFNGLKFGVGDVIRLVLSENVFDIVFAPIFPDASMNLEIPPSRQFFGNYSA